MSAASASLVSGPVATMAMPARESRLTSSRRSSMQRLAFDGGGDFGGEDFAIHGERMAAGHARFGGERSSSESRRRSSSLSSQGAGGS